MITRIAQSLSLFSLLLGGSTLVGDTATASGVREPAELVAWVEARTPSLWAAAVVPVTWHVGDLTRENAAMEADCSGGANDGPLIGFSTSVYTEGTTEYWRQAVAHEYGHVVLCHLLMIDPSALTSWASAAGEVNGAPNHVEMFAQCWARLITGTAPKGYTYRCLDDAAWEATQWLAATGPVAPTASPAPEIEPAPVPGAPNRVRVAAVPHNVSAVAL